MTIEKNKGMFIEPCCIAKELPPLLRKQPFTHFNSNGDWLLTDMMDAVAHLVPQADMTLMLPHTGTFLLRHLAVYFRQGWTRSLRLLTSEDETEGVRRELPFERVRYSWSSSMGDNGIIIFSPADGKGKTLAIQGEMLLQRRNRLCIYNAYFGSDKDIVGCFTEAVWPRFYTCRK